VDDSDEDRYASTPKSPVPVAPKKQRRGGWLSCVKKQTSDENPLFTNPKIGASPSDLADSKVRQTVDFTRES